MPTSLKRRVRVVDETVTLDLPRSTAPGDNAALVALSAAPQSQRRVRLRYRAAEHEETERDFGPYGLAWRAGRWYAVCVRYLRNGLRSFRLNRVRSVQPLDVCSSRLEGFDALEHLSRSVATLPRAFAIEVLLETDLETARRGVFPAFGVLEQVAGGVMLKGQSDDLGWLTRELARLPFAFDIRQPDALREELASCARRLLRQSRS